MEQYISKSALVAEIQGYISGYKDILSKVDKKCLEYAEGIEAKIDILQHLLSFLDTFEVKEVDLEKETQRILDEHFFYPEEDDELKETPKLARYIAKHFFELGLSVSNKAEKEVQEEHYAMSDTGSYTTTTKAQKENKL